MVVEPFKQVLGLADIQNLMVLSFTSFRIPSREDVDPAYIIEILISGIDVDIIPITRLPLEGNRR